MARQGAFFGGTTKDKNNYLKTGRTLISHAYKSNPAPGKWRQEDQKCTASLNYIVRGQPGLHKTLSQIKQKERESRGRHSSEAWFTYRAWGKDGKAGLLTQSHTPYSNSKEDAILLLTEYGCFIIYGNGRRHQA